jgi:hypothetical protein
MEVEFYDVKTRQKVTLPESRIEKIKYVRTLSDGSTQTRFAFRGKTDDGRNLTKFCKREDWEAASVPEVQA